jgi:hypothetical protein
MAQNSEQQPSSRRRGPGRPFPKGTSGNPGGRPKEVRHVQELARAHTLEAIETLVDVMQNSKLDRARVAAAEAILNRAWGRASQSMAVTAAEDGPSLMPDYTEEELIARLMAKRQDRDGRRRRN